MITNLKNVLAYKRTYLLDYLENQSCKCNASKCTDPFTDFAVACSESYSKCQSFTDFLKHHPLVDDNDFQDMPHRPVLLFLAGLSKPEELPVTEFKILTYKNHEDIWSKQKLDYLCHLLFEVQSEDATSTVLNVGLYSFDSETDTDSFMKGYCIAHSGVNVSWKITIEKASHLDMLQLGLNFSKRKNGGGRIISLNFLITHNASYIHKLYPYTVDVIDLYLHIDSSSDSTHGFGQNVSIYFPKLKTLVLSGSFVSMVDVLRDLPKLKSLENVSTGDSPLVLGDTIYFDISQLNRNMNFPNRLVWLSIDHHYHYHCSYIVSQMPHSVAFEDLKVLEFKPSDDIGYFPPPSLQSCDRKLRSVYLVNDDSEDSIQVDVPIPPTWSDIKILDTLKDDKALAILCVHNVYNTDCGGFPITAIVDSVQVDVKGSPPSFQISLDPETMKFYDKMQFCCHKVHFPASNELIIMYLLCMICLVIFYSFRQF